MSVVVIGPSGARTCAWVASTRRLRLLGLALLKNLPPERGLLIPRCRSVHTFGMRFAIDVVFLDRDGRAVELREGLRPGRLATAPGAAAVLELPAGGARRLGLA